MDNTKNYGDVLSHFRKPGTRFGAIPGPGQHRDRPDPSGNIS